jgi:hypothetical protein
MPAHKWRPFHPEGDSPATQNKNTFKITVMATNSIHSRFFALIRQLPHADREQLVFDSSGGRTASLNEFVKTDLKGYNAMLNNMQRMADELNGKKSASMSGDALETEKRRYRHYILKVMSRRGIVVTDGDYSEVNAVIQRWAKTRKTMKTMTLDELKNINKCVHRIMDWHDAKAAKIRILEMSN